MQFRLPVIALVVGALSLGVAACGSDDEESTTAAGSEATTTQAAEPVAAVTGLTGEDTQVTLDADFVAALESLKVTPGPVGDATISKKGVASFPITGGDVTYYKPGSRTPYVESQIDHEGSGLSLEAGGKTVELTDFVVDAGTSKLTGNVTVDGKPAAENVTLFYLDGTTLKPLKANDDGTAELEGTTVRLSEEAATLLNDTFGVDALMKNLPIGIAKITVNTKS